MIVGHEKKNNQHSWNHAISMLLICFENKLTFINWANAELRCHTTWNGFNRGRVGCTARVDDANIQPKRRKIKHCPLKSAHISTKEDVYIALEINLNLNYYSTVDLDISISAECVSYKMPASNPCAEIYVLC